jgi:hypothetical protein
MIHGNNKEDLSCSGNVIFVLAMSEGEEQDVVTPPPKPSLNHFQVAADPNLANQSIAKKQIFDTVVNLGMLRCMVSAYRSGVDPTGWPAEDFCSPALSFHSSPFCEPKKQ